MTFKLLLFVFPIFFNLKHREPLPYSNSYGSITVTRDSVPDTRDSLQVIKVPLPPLHTIAGKDILTVTTSFQESTVTVTLKNNQVYIYHSIDWDYEDHFQSTDPAIVQAIRSIKKTFIKAEHMPEFPGGNEAWEKYLSEYSLQHQDEIESYGPAELMVSFIVYMHGQIADVQVISARPNSKLSALAMDCIKNSPPWTPAVQNGHTVICYHRQLIKFSTRN